MHERFRLSVGILRVIASGLDFHVIKYIKHLSTPYLWNILRPIFCFGVYFLPWNTIKKVLKIRIGRIKVRD